jgi:hypothetical protein
MNEALHDLTLKRPWFKEPWLWFLMGIPGLTVIAGCYTLWLSLFSFDGLVTDDYVKQGLAINQMIERDDAARERGLQASVMRNGQEIRVLLTSQGTVAPPDRLKLNLSHPTRSTLDYSIVLMKGNDGFYSGQLQTDVTGRRKIVLEDQDSTWRLKGNWQLSDEAHLQLFPPAANIPR